MSIKLMSKVWRMTLPATDKLILLALADWSSDDGIAFPKQCTLSAKASVADRTVRQSLKRLREEFGLIEWERRKNKKTGATSNIYYLTFSDEEEQPIIVKRKLKPIETPEVKPKQKPKLKQKKSKPLSHLEVYPDALNIAAWIEWLEYKKEQHGFMYKSDKSETKGIKDLLEKSGGDWQQQQRIVDSSIANGYKGLFGGNNNANRTATSNNDNQIISELTENFWEN